MTLRFSDLIYPKGKIDRGSYLVWGMILLLIKYNLDRLISLYYTGNSWNFLNYLIDFEKHTVFLLSANDQRFYLALVITALPFIWAGTVLTLKRLRSAGLPLLLVIFFFIPFVNLLSFAVLSIMPQKEEGEIKTGRPSFLKRIIPSNSWGNAAFAVFFTIVICLLLTVFAIYCLEDYGWGLFIGIPFLLGLSSSLLYGYHQKRTLRECLSVTVSALILTSGLIFFLAMEGLICLFMALPVAVILAIIGAVIGYYIQSKRQDTVVSSLIIVVLSVPVLMSFERIEKPEANIYSVTSSVLIDATPDKVWKNVVTFSVLPEPQELLFKSGIAYPIYAEIEGKGKGAVRCCVFNTGKFIEPIEIWEDNRLLQFSVLQQPHPMIELTPYKDIHAPHLSGYFASTKGQFLLIPQPDGKTLLEGTTWYYNKVWPNAYWKQWSDYILHQIHMRVLKHIKKEAEK